MRLYTTMTPAERRLDWWRRMGPELAVLVLLAAAAIGFVYVALLQIDHMMMIREGLR